MYWARETQTWHILDEFIEEEKLPDGRKVVRSSTGCEKEIAVPLVNGETSPDHVVVTPKGDYPKGLVCIQCAPNA